MPSLPPTTKATDSNPNPIPKQKPIPKPKLKPKTQTTHDCYPPSSNLAPPTTTTADSNLKSNKTQNPNHSPPPPPLRTKPSHHRNLNIGTQTQQAKQSNSLGKTQKNHRDPYLSPLPYPLPNHQPPPSIKHHHNQIENTHQTPINTANTHKHNKAD